ncbi:pas-domain protein [Ectocarpus siliculosus]|uniref:Pas-domain protein n=1 Tax=Ectocarpus siliculosus TaxID=2880 RepID=D7FSB6_ECTSI|nr:pas-domain protein [Ectocarpus siliculosus]|eukprot:CBJ31057.1 pas-domain protein [Ectocarpus siliculosus]
MTAKNERMKQHALVLSMLPDLVLAVCRTGEMTYVSPACQWLLLHSPEDMTGANIFELVAPECHPLLRKIISDNLSRPVKSIAGGAAGGWSSAKSLQGGGSADGDGVGGDADAVAGDDEPQCREKKGNHRERLQQRCRQQQSQPGECPGIGSGGRGGSAPTSLSLQRPPKMKMLRIFRGDKTTVWCESRLSVRNAKRHDGNSTAAPVPLEIILTLRTVAEGGKTAVAREFAGGQLSMATGPSSAPPGEACVGTGAPAPADADADDADREEDAEEEYVEADDDGYQCEVEAAEEDSNNSGSGKDWGTRGGGGKGKRAAVTPSPRDSSGASAKQGPEATGAPKMAGAAEAEAEPADPAVGREERSLSKKRQRVSLSNHMDEELRGGGGGGGGGADKSGGDNSSTGGDTGGSTTHEGSVSCSNEADSTGEGSNNEGSSKWGDGDGRGGVNAPEGRGSYRDCGNSSEDGDGDVDGASEEGTSAEGTEFGDDVQTAVQSLILMGGDYNNKAAQ